MQTQMHAKETQSWTFSRVGLPEEVKDVRHWRLNVFQRAGQGGRAAQETCGVLNTLDKERELIRVGNALFRSRISRS